MAILRVQIFVMTNKFFKFDREYLHSLEMSMSEIIFAFVKYKYKK